MKAAAKALSFIALCVGLVLLVGAPPSGALLSGLVVAGMMLHGRRCEHARRSFEASTFHAGSRLPAHWYCADCGRTWLAPLDGRVAPSERGAPTS